MGLSACSDGGPDSQNSETPQAMTQPNDARQTPKDTSNNAFHLPKFTKLGTGEIVRFPGHDVLHHVQAADLSSNVALTEITLAPKMLGAPPHIHDNEDEIFIVMSGKVHFLNGRDEIIGETGTVASLPRRHFHGFWNPYDEPVTMLLLIAPGHFESFFAAVEKAVNEGEPKTPPEIGAIIAQQAAARGATVDMSKLPPSGLALLGPPPE